MGTDIHWNIEVRRPQGWELLLSSETDDWVYPERNYNLFAILADIRNGYGFAGAVTGSGFTPILGGENPRRGLPEDLSDDVALYADKWRLDAYAHSWLTLDELLMFDWWGQRVRQRRVVKLPGGDGDDEWLARVTRYANQFGHLPNYVDAAADAYGRGVVVRMADGSVRGAEDSAVATWLRYAEVWWDTSYALAVRPQWFMVLAHNIAAARRAGVVDLNDARAVFWFDN